LAAGNWRLGTGGWLLVTGNWWLATGNWQEVTELESNSKSDFRFPVSGLHSPYIPSSKLFTPCPTPPAFTVPKI